LQDASEAAFHRRLPAPEHRDPLTPPSRHIDHLKRMAVLPSRTLASMMDQVNLYMARFASVPGNTFHGHLFSQLVRPLRSFARQALLATAVLAQQTRDGGFADLAQLLLHLLTH